MFGILLSAFNTVLGFLLREVIVKFAVIFALYFVIQEFLGVLGQFVPDVGVVQDALAAIPDSAWYFADLFAVSQGIPIILTACVSRFLIRRLPVIG